MNMVETLDGTLVNTCHIVSVLSLVNLSCRMVLTDNTDGSTVRL